MTDKHEQAEIFVDWYNAMTGNHIVRKVQLNETLVILTLGMREFQEKGFLQAGFTKRMHFSASCASETLESMVEQGLIEKIKNPENERNNLVRLTKKGREVYEELTERFAGYHEIYPIKNSQEMELTPW